MRKRLLFIGLGLVIVAILAFALRDYARGLADIIVAAYQAVRPMIFLAFVPQPVLWFILLLIACIFLADSTLGRPRRRRGDREVETPRHGRVGEWGQWLRQAKRRPHQDFYRWRLAKNLSMLAMDVLSHGERAGPEQGGPSDGEEVAALPADVQAYLQAGQTVVPFRRFAFLRRVLRLRSEFSPLDLDPERVVGFLEKQLEVGHADRDQGSGGNRETGP